MTLTNQTSVQRWFRQLRKKAASMENGQIPDATKKYALAALRKYCEFAKMTPDQLIADVQHELREKGQLDKHNDMLDAFWESYPTKTTAGIYFRYIRSFYHHNGVELTTTTPTIPKVREYETRFDNMMIHRLCDIAPLKHASWMLMNNYMGLRIGAITQLAKKDFATENWTQDRPLYPVYIRQSISGTFDYTVFIGHDAKTQLETYFTTVDSEQPWNYSEGFLIRTFKKYAYRASIIDAPHGLWRFGDPKGLCPLRQHAFRKRLQTTLEKSMVPLNWVDHMLGHVPRGAQAEAYSQPQEEELYDAYLKALPHLEIYGHHARSPALPAVELQRTLVMQQIRQNWNLDEEELARIENALKNIRTNEELDGALKNVMKVARHG